jgi:hypothetical protein
MRTPPLNRRSLMRNPRYRDELFRQGQDVQEVISREIMAATEKLAQRMPFETAYRLACQTAEETGAGYRSWEKVKPVKEALAALVGPEPLTCPSCGAIVSCPLCGANGRAK